MKTTMGEIEIEFLPDVAPNHVANFIYLTELG
ncbi:MAG: peptidylprolyl isomerase, partial [Planctomycetota bacterium]